MVRGFHNILDMRMLGEVCLVTGKSTTISKTAVIWTCNIKYEKWFVRGVVNVEIAG